MLITGKKKCKKYKHMETKQHFLNKHQVTEAFKRKIKKISSNKWQWKHDNSKPMGCSESSSKREVYSNTILPQETRKYWIDNLTLHLENEGKKIEEGKKS